MNIQLLFLALMVTYASGLTNNGPTGSKLLGPDTGNWTVGDCILIQFAMEFTFHYEYNNTNITKTIEVPPTAKVNSDESNCGTSDQEFQIFWQDNADNATSVKLNRTLALTFSHNVTYYGVSHLLFYFTLAQWTSNTTNYTSTVIIDSDVMPNLMFHTPVNKSYLCANVGEFGLNTRLVYPVTAPDGTKLANSTVIAKRVRFDAFRSKDKSTPPGFRTPMDCDYKPNDIVPIAVGIALALLVVAVVIAYLVGRRKHRQRGYQSV